MTFIFDLPWKPILTLSWDLLISMYTCSRPKISRRFRIWSQIRSNLNILGDIAIFWFLLDIKKNAPEKWFVGYFSEVYHPIRGSYTSFCDNVISNNLIPSFLQSGIFADYTLVWVLFIVFSHLCLLIYLLT